MARKKLFGNTKDPRCETCLHGRRSSDGDSILCSRGGVLPFSHHCRHFRYDPLRRTPNRVRPLEEFDAAEFALDDLSAEWLETVTKDEPSPEDMQHSELMQKLRDYLNETPSPNVDDILLLLNETPVTSGDTEALLAEADALLAETNNPADDDLPEAGDILPDENTAEVPAQEPTPDAHEEAVAPWHADPSLDIEGDLERLTVDVVQSSTPAAFRHFDLKLGPGGQVEERDDIHLDDGFSENELVTMPVGDDTDDRETLRAEDLIFLSEMQMEEEDNASIAMNADGTFTQL